MNLFPSLKKSISLRSFYIMSLALLLIFSPCSVRNSVQSFLNVTQTAVSNKSKTTQVNSSTCLEIDTTVSVLDNPISKSLAFLPSSFFLERYNFVIATTKEEKYTSLFRKANYLSSIPFYILYKQLKLFFIA